MFFNPKIRILFMAKSSNVTEILIKHLFGLKFYLVESFLLRRQQDVRKLKLLKKSVNR